MISDQFRAPDHVIPNDSLNLWKSRGTFGVNPLQLEQTRDWFMRFRERNCLNVDTNFPDVYFPVPQRLYEYSENKPGAIFWCQHHCLKQENRDDVIKWKHFPRHWSFVRGIHRSPVNSPHKGQWRGALMFSFAIKKEEEKKRNFPPLISAPNNLFPPILRSLWCVPQAGYTCMTALTHWGRDNIDAVLQKTFSNAFSSMNIVVF